MNVWVNTRGDAPGTTHQQRYENATYRQDAGYLLITCDSNDKPPKRLLAKVPLQNIVHILEEMPKAAGAN